MKIVELVVYNVALVEAYLCTKWHLDLSSCLAITGMGQKLGGCYAAPLGETISPGSRPTSVPSGILIHPAI